jgi:hypothetical protein
VTPPIADVASTARSKSRSFFSSHFIARARFASYSASFPAGRSTPCCAVSSLCMAVIVPASAASQRVAR